MNTLSLPGDILAFLTQYRDAFNALDGDAVAGFYAEPAVITQAGKLTYWPTVAAARDNIRVLCACYREGGFVEAVFTVCSFLRLGDLYAAVDLAWVLIRKEGRTPWRFNTSYNLMRTSAGWRIILCTAYEEVQFQRMPN